MAHILQELNKNLSTDVLLTEDTKTYREGLVKEMLKSSYHQCKDIIREKGAMYGAKCVCSKLTNKEWQIITLNQIRSKVKEAQK